MAKKKRNWVQIVSFTADQDDDIKIVKAEKKEKKRKKKGDCGC